MWSYTAKKELDHTAGVDTSDLVSKKGFTASKAEVDKLDINKLVNVPTSFNDWFKNKNRRFRC